MNEVKAGFGSPSGPAPAEVVGGQHTLGAVAFGLEREEAVPRPDVEHGLAREVLGKANLTQFVHGVVLTGRYDTVSKGNGVKPIDILDASHQFVVVAHGLASPLVHISLLIGGSVQTVAHFLSLCNCLACLAHSSRLTRPGKNSMARLTSSSIFAVILLICSKV